MTEPARPLPATELVEETLDACRALVAISARSVAAVADVADLVEVRVLVVVRSRRTAALREVAEAVGLHMSTASRLCDRMVARGLLARASDPADRRQLALTVAPEGEAVLRTVLHRRRRAVERVLGRIPPARRAGLLGALREFAEAADEHDERDLWLLGWTS